MQTQMIDEIKVIYKKRLDLNDGTHETSLPYRFVKGDREAHKIVVQLMQDGHLIDFSTADVWCYVTRQTPSVESIAMRGVVKDNGICEAILSQACYTQAGELTILIKVTMGDVQYSPLVLKATVLEGHADVIIDDQHIIPSLTELLEQGERIETALESVETSAEAAETAVKAADAAIEAANTAKDDASSAATLARNAATEATNAAKNANAATDAAEAATTSANTAAGAVNDAISRTETATDLANTSAKNADEKAALANTAATNANNKATLANTAAGTANTAATNADGKATLADEKATLASDAASDAAKATTLANNAAKAANTAATNADDKAALANTAATKADSAREFAQGAGVEADYRARVATEAAENANTKAAAANTAADRADAAAASIEGATITQVSIPYGETPQATLTKNEDGTYNFGLQAERGPGFTIKGEAYATLAALKAAITNPEEGDQYNVGGAAPFNIYRWTGTKWEDDGRLQGVDGVSPTVTTSKSGSTTTITITDVNGTRTATVNDGATGATGPAGKDGQDGKDGLTTSVNGVEQVDGNVTLTGNDVPLSGVSSVTITSAILKRAAVERYSATLTVAGWSSAAPYTQVVSVVGMTATKVPHCDVILSADNDVAVSEKEAWGCVDKVESGMNQLTVTCLADKPEVALNMQIEVVY